MKFVDDDEDDEFSKSYKEHLTCENVIPAVLFGEKQSLNGCVACVCVTVCYCEVSRFGNKERSGGVPGADLTVLSSVEHHQQGES